jgi:type II secretory pathway component GspD/PulD (secretin)
MCLRCRPRFLAAAVLLAGLCGVLAAGEADPNAPLAVQLPRQSDLAKLTDLVAELTGLPMQFDPQQLKGTVRLEVGSGTELTRRSLWDLYNQVLASRGFTTVLTGDPPVYQVVPVGNAGALARLDLTETELRTYPPGFVALMVELQHVGADQAAKALAAILADRSSQARELEGARTRLLLTGLRERINDARRALALLDRPGVVPVFHSLAPSRAAPAALQAAVKGAWTALDRISAAPRPIEVQVSPDGRRLLLIAEAEVIDEVVRLAKALDESEPVETRTYRPRYYGITEVARLIEQVMESGQDRKDPGFRVIRNELTEALIVSGTGAQHARVAAILHELDEAPAEARRQVRSFTIRNRKVEDLARILQTMAESGLLAARVAAAEPVPGTVPAVPEIPAGPKVPAGPETPAASPPSPVITAADPPAREMMGPLANAGGSALQGLVITTDPVTSAIIALGEPRLLAQLEKIIGDLDQRQPQVELEVLLFTLSDSESRDLGVELMRLFRAGGSTVLLSSIFGLGGDETAFPALLDASVKAASRPVYFPGTVIPWKMVPQPYPAPALAGISPFNSGFNGTVVNPGDFAAVVRALEAVTDGSSLIRARVVVDNNAQAALNGVVQEPYSSINASNTVSTTSYGGTSDAGTQITVTPQIAAGDQVSLVYDITQSSFLGNSTVGPDGSITPPPKRSDMVKSTATIPDGFVIGLGGLTANSDRFSESRLPVLGSIPLLGHLFKTSSKTRNDSRFYVFIRANVLRHNNFEDLKHLSRNQLAAAGLADEGWPVLQARFLD